MVTPPELPTTERYGLLLLVNISGETAKQAERRASNAEGMLRGAPYFYTGMINARVLDDDTARCVIAMLNGEPMPNATPSTLADAWTVADFVAGWWPGLEDGIQWPDTDNHPVFLAAKRLRAALPKPTP